MKTKTIEISAQEFLTDFSPKTHSAPVYALIGGDMFYMGKVLQLLTQKFVDPNSRDFDFIQYFGGEIKNDSFMEQLDMLPFMGNKRVVIIRDLDSIDDIKYLQKLPAYLKDPSPEVILILTAEKIDARTVLGKEINERTMRIICREPRYKNDIRNWLNAELGKRQVRMENQAKEFFCDTVQMSYCAAVNEFEKIILFTNGEKDSITLQDVKSALGVARSSTIYELQDALGDQKCVQSLVMLEKMLQNDIEPIYIIYMINGFYQQLWRILLLLKRNMNQSEIMQRYMNDVFPSFREKILRFAKNYTIPQIRRVFDLLMLADTDLKSSPIKKNVIMDLLIYKICNPSARV
jgi:DNA polymerase III subunit delta